MTEIEKVCGNCANHCRTSKYGSRGCSVKACRPEVMAWRKSIEGARLFTRDYRGYGPRHRCHRPDDFEPRGGPVLARAALAAVLVPLGIVCWVAMDEVRRTL